MGGLLTAPSTLPRLLLALNLKEDVSDLVGISYLSFQKLKDLARLEVRGESAEDAWFTVQELVPKGAV